MVLFSLLVQERKQRRYKVHFCWCNHLWHSDTFYAMHHLMRLSLAVEEAISFLLEPTSDPPLPPPSPLAKAKRRAGRWKGALPSPLVKPCNSKGEVHRKLDQRQGRKHPCRGGDGHCQGGQRSLITFYAGLFPREHHEPSPPQRGSSIKQRKRSITEEAARNWRYQSCHRLAIFHTCRVITVGHTASDGVETSFFNLLRGSGIKGVTAIQPTRVVRPLYPKHFPLSNFYGVTLNTFE